MQYLRIRDAFTYHLKMDSQDQQHIFDQALHDEELAESFRSHTFSEEDLKALCEIPCVVQMNICNRYWSYETMVIEQLKRKQIVRDDTHEYVYEKFSKKFRHHYRKQLQWEEDHRQDRTNRLFSNKVNSVLYLEDKNSKEYIPTSEENESMHIAYTPYSSDPVANLNSEDAAMILSPAAVVSNNSSIYEDVIYLEDASSENSLESQIESAHSRRESVEDSPGTDLEGFVHQLGSNVAIAARYSDNNPILPSQGSASETYSEFRENAEFKSTQQT